MRRSSVWRSTTRPKSTAWRSAAIVDDRRSGRLPRCAISAGLVRPCGPQFAPGADAELREHLAQVPLHGARTEKEPCGDIRVGQAVAGEACNLQFLLGQCIARLLGSLAHLLPDGEALASGALGECLHAHGVEE